MQNIEIKLPSRLDPSQAEKEIDIALVRLGLEIALRGSLRKFPGCIHWHARNPGMPGTLEITLWPQQHRAWLTVQRGRSASWITARLPQMRRVLARHLRGAGQAI